MSQCPVADLDLTKWKVPMIILGVLAIVVTWNPDITDKIASVAQDMDIVSAVRYVLIAMVIFMSVGAVGLVVYPDEPRKARVDKKQPTTAKTDGNTNEMEQKD